MALFECVDCGKKLSPTATGCNGCSSTDPFGNKRASDKLRAILMLMGLASAGLVWLAFHYDFLTFEMVKSFLNHQAK